MDDMELLSQIQTGDREAFNLIFLKYYPLLTRFCDSLGCYTANSEDIIADVFLTLWIKRETVEIHTSLKFYLYAAVRNQVYTLNAKGKKMQLLPEEHAHNNPGDANLQPDEIMFKKDRNLLIQRFMNELPEQGRLVFLLKWQHQLDYSEIAQILQISASTVKTHVYRSVAYIRKQLSFVK